MNIAKKLGSIGLSATLLASLFATAVAPSVFAAATVSGVGNVGRGSTSTNSATFTFSEETTGCILAALGGAGAPNAPVDLTVTIAPKAPITGTVQFVGTPTLVAPGSLAATAAVVQSAAGVNDTLRIRIGGADAFNKQQITVTGLQVKASSGATLGAIQTLLNSSDGGALATCFLASTTTATGTVSAAIGISAVNQSVNIAVSSSAAFAVTAGTSPDKLVFASGESVAVIAAGPVVGGIQTLTIGPTTVVHPANEAVSQANVPAVAPVFPYALASVGTVTDSVRQDVWVPAGGLPAGGAGALTAQPNNIFPGEQNQPTNSTYVYERTGSQGFIAKNTVLTFTIATAGVLFSTSPSVQALDAATGAAAAGMTLDGTLCTISFDRTSCTIKVTAASTAPAAVDLYNIKVDVASTVAKGTAVNINVTGVPVAVDFNTVAYVSRVVVGVAAQPTIFINFNDQASGMMSLTESGPGFFQDASVYLGNNVFGLCITSGETFTRAPWAVVSTGDLKLLSGLVGATSVQGTLFNGAACAYWTVYSASTVASTIDIRGSDASNVVLPAGPNNGPRLSVGPNLQPGPTLVNILIADKATVLGGGGITSKVSNAVRAFKDQPVVAAVPPLPVIPPGTARAKLANLTITETLAGQFKQDEAICVDIVPLNMPEGYQYQTHFVTTNFTADQPVVTSNTASGLLLKPVFTVHDNFFCFSVAQQAVGTLGVITISNMVVFTPTDATAGNILVDVSGGFGVFQDGVGVAANFSLGQAFEQTVAAASIGKPGVSDAWIASGLNVRSASAFGLGTAAVKRGTYVTIRAKSSNAPAGALGQIWVKTKTTAWHLESSRRVGTDGYLYYSGKVLNLGYRYFKVTFTAGGTSNVVRAFGK